MVSVLRSITTFFLVIFLSFLLSCFILSFSISESTKPEIIKSIFKGLFESSIPSTDLNESYHEFLLLCINRTYIEIPTNKGAIENIKVSCNDINKGNPSDLGSILAESIFNEIYYKDYNCFFLDCLKNSFNSTFLLSNSARNLLANISYIILAVFFVFLILFMPFLKFRGIASVFLINGIPTFLFFTRERIITQMSQIQQFLQFVPLFFNLLYYISLLSLICLAVGLTLLITSKLFHKKSIKPKNRKR